jgi:hypothetical protein
MAGCGASPAAEPAPGNEEQTAAVSQELSAYSWDYEYYSDASYTTLVGFWGGNCGGGTGRWGTRTKYVIGDRENCKTGATVGCWEIIDGRDYCGYTACVIC